jgi:hypothetical protein
MRPRGRAAMSARMRFLLRPRVNADVGRRPDGHFHPKTSIMTSLHTTPVGMHPLAAKDQITLSTNNWIPSTWPFFRGGQTLSHLQLSGTKDFCTATNPLLPRIPTLQSLPGRRFCEVAAPTLHFHQPSM